jgi:hypothetical protein
MMHASPSPLRENPKDVGAIVSASREAAQSMTGGSPAQARAIRSRIALRSKGRGLK